MKSPASGQSRTNFIPPPTANIPGRNGPVSLPGTPQQATPRSRELQGQTVPFSAVAAVAPWQDSSSKLSPSAEFAPNAFSSAPQYAQPGEGPKWYDRLMDVILGEDETLPRNRLALICHQCRLINGQAPPGVQRLEEVGQWRCSGCGFMNGEEKEEARILKEIQEHAASPSKDVGSNEAENVSAEESDTKESVDEGSDYEEVGGGGSTQSSESGRDGSAPAVPGETSGVQKEPVAARRRSGRVQKKAKG
ncbi:MAG: hypothetical protein Q9219_000544 [cf. Caloplaca sp. 3 TL-2023]